MKCPHCLVNFHVTERTTMNYSLTTAGHIQIHFIGKDVDGYWWLEKTDCPACERVILRLISSDEVVDESPVHSYSKLPSAVEHAVLVRPKGVNRVPVPAEVPPEFARDYLAACRVIVDSPEASAALSRRCLQQILRDKAQVQHPNNLAEAIKEVVNSSRLPTDLANSLDAVQNIGNFGAHPNKSLNTGEIVEVEPGEAEWSLEVIELLFDHYFVRPADIQRRKQALDSKLAETGKPPSLGSGC